MKKRAISLLLALVLAFSLAPAALAEDDGPPYSLEYLDGIDGLEYVNTWNYDDYVSSTGEDVSLVTIDVYNAWLWLDVNGDWDLTVAPLRQRFKDAGFTEEIKPDEYGDNWYWYTNGSGHLFRIMGETASQAVLNESGTVYVTHDFSVKFMDAQTAPQTPAGTLDNFRKSRTYTSGQFSDVSSGEWYASSVQAAYELGLVNGSGVGFSPANPISVAETLALACRIRDIYYGGAGEFSQGDPWYQVYVDYAVENGIISAGAFQDYTASASRQTFAAIMAKALPGTALAPINDIKAEAISDSGSISANDLSAVLRLYNAGIITGGDGGAFNPSSNIQRSEVAALVTRMAIPGERKRFELAVPEVVPEPGDITYDGIVPDFGAFSGLQETGQISGDFGTYHSYDLAQVQKDSTLVNRYYDLLTEKGFQRRRTQTINGSSMEVYGGKDNIEVAIGAMSFSEGDKDFYVLVSWDSSLPNAGSTQDSPPSTGEPVSEELLINYAFTDFQRIKRQYSAATPLYAKVSSYTNLDGDVCVITNVWYKIISDYHEVTLHNLTSGREIIDPVGFYEYMEDMAWGAAKIRLLELQSEVLAHLNGKTYVTADQLDF